MFNTDSTLTANRIFGFIDGISRAGTSLRTDSMEMIRKRVNHNNPPNRYNIHAYHKLGEVIDTPVPSERKEAETDSVAS